MIVSDCLKVHSWGLCDSLRISLRGSLRGSLRDSLRDSVGVSVRVAVHVAVRVSAAEASTRLEGADRVDALGHATHRRHHLRQERLLCLRSAHRTFPHFFPHFAA